MDKLGLLITLSEYIVFLSGKGVSLEADATAELGEGAEKILTESYFNENTNKFYDYYKNNVLNHKGKITKTHEKLLEMEKKGKLKAIITTNTDSLHKKMGNVNVLELHGSENENRCVKCNKVYDAEYIKNHQGVPMCSCGGVIKPGILLYDGALDEKVATEAVEHIKNADLLIVAGCSLMSYPSSSLLRYFHGQYLALINEDVTEVDRLANFVSHEKISEVMEKLEITPTK